MIKRIDFIFGLHFGVSLLQYNWIFELNLFNKYQIVLQFWQNLYS